MKHVKTLLTMAMMLCTGQAVAQNEGELVDVLPEGVTANVNPERKQDKQKNIVVAGSPEKGYKAFFAASDADHGEELWVTDGTKEGTHIVADIVPGNGSSDPSYLGRLNDKVLFAAYTDDWDVQAWITDGTAEGTVMLTDYMFGAKPVSFIQMDEKRAVFAAYDEESSEYDPDRGPQRWLWITDGTAAGTKRVAKCDMRWPGQDNTTLHTAYVRVGRRVFFKADNIDGSTGEELWVTDGTEEGTYCVMDVNWERWPEGEWGYAEGYTRNCGLDNLENYKNEGCFFQAWTPDYGGEPWYTDGTKALKPNGPDESGDDHTYMIKDTRPGKNENGIGYHAGTFGTSWEVYKDRMWWRGWDATGGYELAGSNMQKGDYVYIDVWDEAPSVNNNSFVDPGCVFDGYYMFCAAHGFDAANENHYGGELWATDGEKVWLQYGNWRPGTLSNWVKEQVVAGGSMYWWNEENIVESGYATSLYRLDAWDAEPVVCTHIDMQKGDLVNTLRNMGGTIVFASDATKRVYAYKYTKPGWDGQSDMGYLEPDFMTEAEKTAIQDVNYQSKEDDNQIYDLQGRRVSKVADGTPQLLIKNGKKFFVK